MMRFAHVLCPVDFSDASQHALDQAAALAGWYDARLTMLYVFASRPSLDLPPLVLTPDDRERLRMDMVRMAERVPARVAVDYRVVEAEQVHDAILAEAAAVNADLLVLGTHGRSGFQRLFLGSVTEKVIRKSTCPTLVVPPRAAGVAPDAPVRLRSIVCGIDFSASSRAALDYALPLAEEADAHVLLVHAIAVPPELNEHLLAPDFDVDRARAAAEASALRTLRQLVPDEARAYCTVETAVAEGNPAREILRVAAERAADLIVLGVQGRGAVDVLLFGSTAHHVVRGAPCPVLLVPTTDRRTAAAG